MGRARPAIRLSRSRSRHPFRGSRTGLYTGDYADLHFRAPEEVRKAGLRDTDLRGANLAEADLYLVDLRGARLDPEQRAHAARCRAIL